MEDVPTWSVDEKMPHESAATSPNPSVFHGNHDARSMMTPAFRSSGTTMNRAILKSPIMILTSYFLIRVARYLKKFTIFDMPPLTFKFANSLCM